MIAPARRVALDALSSVSAGADLPDLLARTREQLADERDRALAAAIVIGTLRWRGRLDFHLQQAISRNLGKLDAIVLDVLRMSLFQLLFLERVPAAAVVDDAVSLVRRGGKTSAGGFVNGVLRTISRTRDRLSLPAMPAAIHSPGDRDLAVDALHIAGSHPRWLVARWIDRLGLDAASAWVAFNNVEPPLTLRVNRSRATRETIAERLRALGVETVPTRVAPDGLTVVEGNPLRTAMANSGDFLIQDEASQLVPLLVGARPGHRVLDACAAPGGKSVALADALQGTGLLVAADARDRRVALLRRVLNAHGAHASLVEHDLHAGAPFGPAFDRVLVDAPCTGLGTLRRDVDIRWRRGPDDPGVAARRQGQLLAEASAAVAPGGRLVYATCSSEPEENEQVVSAFLDDHAGFRRVPAKTLIGEGMAAALLNPETGELVTRPDHHGLECFYAAAVERVR
jgi:16S rRNA (cytosine967-C5)-methyltransferase